MKPGRILLALCLAVGAGAVLRAQTGSPAREAPRPRPPVPAAISAEPSGQPATFVFFNRPIVELRARVFGRTPVERAEGASRVLDELVAEGVTGPVEWQSLAGGALITVASRGVLVLSAADVDELSGEGVEGATARAVERMRHALDEAAEARTPSVLLRSGAVAGATIVLALLMLWGIMRGHRIVGARLVAIAEQTVARSGLADVDAIRASRVLDVERWFLAALSVTLELVIIYATIGVVLRRFPYTRPWGESMRRFLLSIVQDLGLGVANAIPGLLTVVVIFFIARFLTRLIGFFFNAIEQGRVTLRYIYPETAQPTRRLLTLLLWVFAIILAYPHLPGSQTDAFKGVSVFLGLMVTFGSSGLVNQIMSGFMITYSRALRVGDYVRVGDVEGSVTHLGVLSTKVTTLRREEVTIPNAVVVAQTTTDYSRSSEIDGVFTPTSVTIGYDTPWRQVQALLLLAAERTAGLRSDPKPVVLQTSLEDFYVKYTLWVSLERQQSRLTTLHALHANVQDLFNEYGVQIMSPNYVLDPAAPKVVPKQNWFAAPACPAPAPPDA